MALFGRDALIAAYMALPVDRELALGVLEALAELQGAASTRPPRRSRAGSCTRPASSAPTDLAHAATALYYGSVDATPLFVVLLGELLRWGLDDDRAARGCRPRRPGAEWIDDYGDRDGDGYVEYLALVGAGLVEPGMEGLGRRDPLSRRPGRGGAAGVVRGAGLRVRRVHGAGRDRRPARRDRRARSDGGPPPPTSSALQPRLLGRRARLVRAGARPRQGARRLADLEHRALPVVGDRRRRACRRGRRAAAVADRCGPAGASARWPPTSAASTR